MNLAEYFRTLEIPPETPMPWVIKGAVRSHLPELFRQWGYTTGAEIGVYCGDFSRVLCEGNPDLELLCVDRWAPYRSRKSGKMIFTTATRAYEAAKIQLAPFRATLIRKPSVDAARDVPDGSLDFVYLDADHWFDPVIADLQAWIPKVRKGGVVAGHDYTEKLEFDNRVSIAVKAWTQAYEIRPWYVLGRVKVMPGELHDPQRTWMWVKA